MSVVGRTHNQGEEEEEEELLYILGFFVMKKHRVRA